MDAEHKKCPECGSEEVEFDSSCFMWYCNNCKQFFDQPVVE